MEQADIRRLLDGLSRQRSYAGQIVSAYDLAERPARAGRVEGGIRPEVERALDRRGVSSLYSHQAAAIDTLRAGRHVVVVTGTASGKTLCYQVPILEALLEDPLATALLVFPTKALAQDQLAGLEALRESESTFDFLAGTYDGDTPTSLRGKLRDGGRVILTNPDMLHAGILPHHARWSRFFANLRHVVIDEVHAYRGVFGSHLANVLRRLRRITGHHGSDPRFIACSATIANPEEHASSICGVPVTAVTEDGSPAGPKTFVLWNPPPLTRGAAGPEPAAGGERRSPLGEAADLLASLVREGIQTIAFTRTRVAAELVHRNTRAILRHTSRRLADSVKAYRGGYLPEERRAIERDLKSRRLLGVASTNALELGIDIGSLDAAVILGYPGTIASLWQQAGRAGRKSGASLVFLVARNTPIDQYLMHHPEWLSEKSPERAHVDPDNPHIAVGHLRCAAHELSLPDEDAEAFGPSARAVLEFLEDEGDVRRIRGCFYFSSSAYPAADVSLRSMAGDVVTIKDRDRGGKVIGTVDEVSALTQLHDHAVYLHAGETWFVERLDLTQRLAFVTRRDLDYYTQAVQSASIRIDEVEEASDWRGGVLGAGDVTATTSIPMFKKVRFHSRESVGFERLELPPQDLETVAMWFVPPESAVRRVVEAGHLVGEALVGVANVMVEVVPVFLMCDVQDVGAVVDASALGRDALFLYDRFPGGMGYARAARERFEEILRAVIRVISDCPCEAGCPACVGSATPPFAMSDLDAGVRGRIPDKVAARRLAQEVLAPTALPAYNCEPTTGRSETCRESVGSTRTTWRASSPSASSS